MHDNVGRKNTSFYCCGTYTFTWAEHITKEEIQTMILIDEKKTKPKIKEKKKSNSKWARWNAKEQAKRWQHIYILASSTDCNCINVVLQNVAHREKEQHIVLSFESNKREWLSFCSHCCCSCFFLVFAFGVCNCFVIVIVIVLVFVSFFKAHLNSTLKKKRTIKWANEATELVIDEFCEIQLIFLEDITQTKCLVICNLD